MLRGTVSFDTGRAGPAIVIGDALDAALAGADGLFHRAATVALTVDTAIVAAARAEVLGPTGTATTRAFATVIVA
jgi:hypothetical protein